MRQLSWGHLGVHAGVLLWLCSLAAADSLGAPAGVCRFVPLGLGDSAHGLGQAGWPQAPMDSVVPYRKAATAALGLLLLLLGSSHGLQLQLCVDRQATPPCSCPYCQLAPLCSRVHCREARPGRVVREQQQLFPLSLSPWARPRLNQQPSPRPGWGADNPRAPGRVLSMAQAGVGVHGRARKARPVSVFHQGTPFPGWWEQGSVLVTVSAPVQ